MDWVRQVRHWHKIRLTIVPRLGGNRFVVLANRWIVGRTRAWFLKWRRLRCDYERLTPNSETFSLIAMIGLMSRRLAREK